MCIEIVVKSQRLLWIYKHDISMIPTSTFVYLFSSFLHLCLHHPQLLQLQQTLAMMSARLIVKIGQRRLAQVCLMSHRRLSASPMPFPDSEASPTKIFPEKIVRIVDEISTLTLLEVADLVLSH
jgi:hypothetical protein